MQFIYSFLFAYFERVNFH